MQPLSVVIVCKNEAGVIGRMLESLQGLTDDIVVYDNGSTDGTLEIAGRYKVSVHQGTWDGYGKTKHKATALAKYDWVLSLDADEIPDNEIKTSLLNLQLTNEKIVYALRRKNFLGTRYMKFGEWGNDVQKRLFNRRLVNWDDAEVHEKLMLPREITVQKIDGYLLHQTMKDVADYSTKTVKYAMLSAEKYYRLGKKASWVKTRIAPGFSFFKHYFIQLGFLDGQYGYICAKMTARYTFLKYKRLQELEQQNDK